MQKCFFEWGGWGGWGFGRLCVLSSYAKAPEDEESWKVATMDDGRWTMEG